MRVTIVGLLVLGGVAIGCASDSTLTRPGSTPLTPVSGSTLPFIVSSPATSPSTQSVSGAAVRANSSALAYISLPPGTFPTGLSATMTDAQTGSTAFRTLEDGGFDPTPLPAVIGDTVTVDVALNDAVLPRHFSFLVSGDKPPVIVRTDPPAHKRDMPLNPKLVMVFSEPLDTTVLSAASVQLWTDTTRIAGQLAFSDAAHTTVTFTPAADLQGSTDYELVATAAVKSLNGNALGAAVTVPFTTIADSPPVPNSFLFQSSDAIWLFNIHDSTTRQLAIGSDPVWSPDGSQIAFNAFSPTGEGVYVMNADGSGVARVVDGQDATWSPDGTRIAFNVVDPVSGQGDIYVVNADGSGLRWLIQGFHPAWSPDGGRIAFARSTTPGGTYNYSSIFTISPDGSALGALTTFTPPGVGQVFGIHSLTWSPDGSRIAFQGLEGDPDEPLGGLYVMHTDGSYVARLGTGDRPGLEVAEGGVPAWSPDGSKIAFNAYTHDLTIATSDGAFVSSQVPASANPFLITVQPPVAIASCGSNPSWSPNGGRIAYACTPVNNPALGAGIVTVRPDGTGATQVTSFGMDPLWRPGKQ